MKLLFIFKNIIYKFIHPKAINHKIKPWGAGSKQLLLV